MAILSLFLSTNYFTTLLIKVTQKPNKDIENNLIAHIFCQIQTNKLKSYGSKLIGKTSPGCPEHCPKLDALLPRNNLCCPGVADSVAGSVREFTYQLVSVLSPAYELNRL